MLDSLAQRIIHEEGQYLDARRDEFKKNIINHRDLLKALCNLMNLRQRYFGQAGEHFSVQDLTGITLVDTLDDRLLRDMHNLIIFYKGLNCPSPSSEVVTVLNEKLKPLVRDLPQYPIAYMVLYALRKALEAFDSIITKYEADTESPSSTPIKPGSVEELELAFVDYIATIISKYVYTRDAQVARHFSDVAREYSVVKRLKCTCGKEKYEVTLQSLKMGLDGKPYDKLDIKCTDCGAEHSIDFALPYFDDLSKR